MIRLFADLGRTQDRIARLTGMSQPAVSSRSPSTGTTRRPHRASRSTSTTPPGWRDASGPRRDLRDPPRRRRLHASRQRRRPGPETLHTAERRRLDAWSRRTLPATGRSARRPPARLRRDEPRPRHLRPRGPTPTQSPSHAAPWPARSSAPTSESRPQRPLGASVSTCPPPAPSAPASSLGHLRVRQGGDVAVSQVRQRGPRPDGLVPARPLAPLRVPDIGNSQAQRRVMGPVRSPRTGRRPAHTRPGRACTPFGCRASTPAARWKAKITASSVTPMYGENHCQAQGPTGRSSRAARLPATRSPAPCCTHAVRTTPRPAPTPLLETAERRLHVAADGVDAHPARTQPAATRKARATSPDQT